MAPKSNGKVWVYVDPVQLNKSVKWESYHLPRLEETLLSLEGCRYFSKMDTSSGFHLLRLSKESQGVYHLRNAVWEVPFL